MSPYYSTTTTNDTNASVLRETKALQDKSMAALARIRRNAAHTKEIGTETLSTLHNQTKSLEHAETRTTQLRAGLDKADKQHDRFAKLAFRFGNRRKARKELEREDEAERKAKEVAAAPVTFKRKGPRPKKQKPTTDPNQKENQIEERNDTVTFHANRKELVSSHQHQKPRRSKPSRKKTNTKTTASSSSTRRPPKETPMSDKDQCDLRDIEDGDKILDEGIDDLGDEIADLLALSKTMGEVANRQNAKLETIDTNLETTKTQTKLLNKRLKLFTRR